MKRFATHFKSHSLSLWKREPTIMTTPTSPPVSEPSSNHDHIQEPEVLEPSATKQTTHTLLLQVFYEFLNVYTNELFYLRRVYPAESFGKTKWCSFAVIQTRYPDLRKWIENMCQSIIKQIHIGNVWKVSLILVNSEDRPLERYNFNVGQFLRPPENNRNKRIRNLDPDFTEIQAQFRAAIYALRSTVSDIKPIPEGCKCVPILEVKNLESDAYEGADDWLYYDPNTMKSTNNPIYIDTIFTPIKNNVSIGPMSFSLGLEETQTKMKSREIITSKRMS